MPSENIQRNLQNFVSTVISSINGDSTASENPHVTVRASRRTIENGSWIVSDLNATHHHLQQQSLENNSAIQYSRPPIADSQSRQSASAGMEFDFHEAIYTHQPIMSPRNIQISSPSFQEETAADIIESYIETELESNVAANFRSNSQFEVTDLNQAGVPLQQLHQILRGASGVQNNIGVNPSLTSSRASNALRNKIVYKLNCSYCKIPVCDRAMRAILLADTKIELYSTDIPPKAVVTMNEDRMTAGCNCRIRDTVCTGCGNVLGYHVSQPCDRCLDARNNGHFWMFCSEGVHPAERMHFDGNGPLYWTSLPPMCDFVPASSYISPGQSGNTAYESFCR